jgi:hypothetical protein
MLRWPYLPALALPLAALLWAPGCGCPADDDDTATPTEETPAPQYDRGYYLSMALDSAGRPWLAYQDRLGLEEGDAPLLAVARGAGAPPEWTIWQVDGAPDRTAAIPSGGFEGGFYASIALDDSDVPHVTHWNKSGNTLRYATRSGDGWAAEDVENGVGEFATIAIDDDGAPIIAYYNRSGGDLRIAVRNGSGWDNEVVDAGDGDDADVGRYPDILVEASGTIHIAYLDVGNGDLRVASGGPGNWSIETWASEGDVGAWPTLTQHQGDLYVSFEDMGNQDLLLGRWDGTDLAIQTIDDRDFVGPDSAVVWVDDEPVVLYHDGMNNDALMATRSGAVWTRTVHMGNGAVGFHNNLQIDDSGILAWACFDHSTKDFVFQRFEVGPE